MGQQWLRAWQLSAGGVMASGDLRVVFDIKSAINGNPGNAIIAVYNLSPNTAQSIFKAKTVTFAAGYQGGIGMIFSGDVVQVNLGKDNATDTTTTVFAKASDVAHNTGVVNKTLKAGSTGMDVYKTVLQAMPGMSQGRIPTDALQQLKYPRSVTMFGPARNFMRTLAQSINGIFHYDALAPQVHITQNNDMGKGSPIILNSDTGMIGLPIQNLNGINVRCLLNPQIQINSVIHIDQKSIQRISPDLTVQGEPTLGDTAGIFRGGIDSDGLYRVVYLEQVGDSRGESWFCECNCIALSGAGTQSQTRSFLG
jgi:hypothetical protein